MYLDFFQQYDCYIFFNLLQEEKLQLIDLQSTLR